jgi:hypothetical protein
LKTRISLMGALEEKVARLPLEQQREVDDFVDYLLRKSATAYPVTSRGASVINELQQSGHQAPESPAEKQNGPLILAEETHIPRGREILPDYPNYDENLSPGERKESSRAPKRKLKEPGKLLDWID